MARKATKHSGVRAKSGWIEVDIKDKRGRARKARQHAVTGLAGSLSGKEMERTMMNIADEVGASYDQIRIQTYAHGEAPIEVGRDRERFYTTDQYRDNWDRAFSSGESQTDNGEGETQ